MIHGVLHSAWWMLWIGLVALVLAASLDSPQEQSRSLRPDPPSRNEDAVKVLCSIAVLCVLYATYLALN